MWIPVEDEVKCGVFVIRVETVVLFGESVCLENRFVWRSLGDRFVRPVRRNIQRIGLESGKEKRQPNSLSIITD